MNANLLTMGIATVLLIGCATTAPPNVVGSQQTAPLTSEIVGSDGKKYRVLHTPRSRGTKSLTSVFEAIRPSESDALAAKDAYLEIAKKQQQVNCDRLGQKAELDENKAQFNSKYNSWSFSLICVQPDGT